MYADDFELFDDDDQSVPLEQVSRVYETFLPSAAKTSSANTGVSSEPTTAGQPTIEDDFTSQHCDQAAPPTPISPVAIIEAALLVGRPDNGPITASELAAVMRGVSVEEVEQHVEQLNQDYLDNHRAFHIASVGGGYRLQLAEDLLPIGHRFLGASKPVKLSQSAIDCLALVAYQPGISRKQLDEQRGQISGPILNLLVRRELLHMRRESGEGKPQPHYYPTQRMLELIGLQSLEDLPTIED
jgi:segregation and condensation protein B